MSSWLFESLCFSIKSDPSYNKTCEVFPVVKTKVELRAFFPVIF